MKKIKGTLVTQDQVDKQGDTFTKEALDNINVVGKVVLINFEIYKIAGKIINQKRTSNGVEIIFEVTDEFWDEIKVGHGLGFDGFITRSNSDNFISKMEVAHVSLCRRGCHDDWKVTEKIDDKK